MNHHKHKKATDKSRKLLTSSVSPNFRIFGCRDFYRFLFNVIGFRFIGFQVLKLIFLSVLGSLFNLSPQFKSVLACFGQGPCVIIKSSSALSMSTSTIIIRRRIESVTITADVTYIYMYICMTLKMNANAEAVWVGWW